MGSESNIEMEKIQSRVSDLEVALQQLTSILQQENNIPLPPPKHLQVRVTGGYSANFISSGRNVYRDLNSALEIADKELSDFEVILDFGCGCGRVTRMLKGLIPESDFHGTDIDSEAIEWLKNNYSTFAKFSVAPHFPPTSYENDLFDFVFGISVLTHLPEDMQFLWLEELKRITKPGSYLVLTVHGEKHYQKFPKDIQKIMKAHGFYYSEPGFNYGKSISLPDFYQNSYHSEKYIKNEWSKYFEVIEIQKLGMGNHQDTVLLQNRK